MASSASDQRRVRTLKDYRPQHDEDCAEGKCQQPNPDDGSYLWPICGFRRDDPIHEGGMTYAHEFIEKPCSCGLSTLLASEDAGQKREPETDHGAELIHANDTGDGDTLPRLNNRQVWVDLDGVLADFDEHYFRTFGARLDRNGEEPTDLWANIRTREPWFESLPLMPGAIELWDALRPYRPKILSGLSPEKYAPGEAEKRRWVARHFGPDVEVSICRSKHKCQQGKPGDILIDDWFKYSGLWNQMGGVFVMYRNNAETLAIVHALMAGHVHSTAVAKHEAHR